MLCLCMFVFFVCWILLFVLFVVLALCVFVCVCDRVFVVSMCIRIMSEKMFVFSVCVNPRNVNKLDR